jgi:exopolysaccharide biosynthesis WecB/TagA/CpsF family protein
MKKQMIFTRKNPEQVLKENSSGVLNFQNLQGVHSFHNEPNLQKAITSKNNFTFPDGKIVSLTLKTPQRRGPTFTKDFFENNLDKSQKHFFILPDEKRFKRLSQKFPIIKKSKAHFPPYITEAIFPKIEIEKIANKIIKSKPTHVWLGIAHPKQEILSNQLYKKHKAFYINTGAAFDFLTESKKEAPRIYSKLGLEWLYRLLTDFKYSKKKVWQSFVALKHLRKIKLMD